MNRPRSWGKGRVGCYAPRLGMPRRFLLAVPALWACWLLVPSGARAQSAAPDSGKDDVSSRGVRAAPPPPNAWQAFGMRGFEIEVGGMLQTGGGNSPVQAPTLWPTSGASGGFPRGTILDPATAATLSPSQAYAPYSLDPFALSIRVGYRILRDLSVGVFFSFAQYDVNDGADSGLSPDSTSQLERQQVTLGAYARYYFTRFVVPHLQPWILLGAGFNYDIAAYTRPIGQATGGMAGANPETGNYILQQDGIVVPAAAGLDWRLAPVFSVGPTVGFARIFPLKGCVEIDVDQYSPLPGQNTCSSPPVVSYGYDNFYAGVYAKITFDPFTH